MIRVLRLGLWIIMGYGVPFHTSLIAQSTSKSFDGTVHFSSPVRHRVRISGTFGELRPNHFHAGLDIKSSNGHPGDPVYAMADGYISRIKIQSGGYGNALYITYPGGWTVLYAHLQSFTPEVAQYVKIQQYRLKKFSVNLYPKAGKFQFKRGEKVGVMGNSGYSFGPHLHLEMRRNNGNLPFNPLRHLDFIKDTIAPVFRSVKIEGLTPDYRVVTEKKIKVEGKVHFQHLPEDTIDLTAWRAGISIRVYDQVNGSSNKNGIYRIKMAIEGKTVYEFVAQSCSFAKTKYVNAHMDYAEQVLHKQYWHRCYVLPGNHLDMYLKGKEGDVFDLFTHRPKHVEITIEDAAGNTNRLAFYLRRQEQIPEPQSRPFHYQLQYDRDNYMSWSDASFFIPKRSLYKNAYVSVSMTDSPLPTLQIGLKTIPMHRYGTLSVRHLHIADVLRPKLILATQDKNDQLSFGGQWKKDHFECAINRMGNFYLAIDTTPPVITPKNVKKQYRRGEEISLEVKDDYKPSGKAKSLRFSGKIDDRWTLIEYDLKYHTLKHVIDEHTAIGPHTFTLTVKDDRGNKRTFSHRFELTE